LKVEIKKVGQPACAGEIENNLKAMQQFVGGYVEMLPIQKTKLVIVMDEEGKFKDKPMNLYLTLGNRLIDCILGDLFITADDGHGGFRDLTNEEVQKAIEYCNEKSNLLYIKKWEGIKNV
jgi:hypothetical protein